MKAGVVVTLVLAGSAPVMVADMEGNEGGDIMASIFAKAEEIAARDYGQNATLVVHSVTDGTERIGTFGETIESDPGYHFAFARVTVLNTGKIDLAVSGWQFYGVDEWGDEHPALLGGAHDDFNAGRVRSGGRIGGTVAFEVPNGSELRAVVWQGDLASATGPVP